MVFSMFCPCRCIYVRGGRAWVAGGQPGCNPWMAMFDATTYQLMDTHACTLYGPATAMERISWQVRTARACGACACVAMPLCVLCMQDPLATLCQPSARHPFPPTPTVRTPTSRHAAGPGHGLKAA